MKAATITLTIFLMAANCAAYLIPPEGPAASLKAIPLATSAYQMAWTDLEDDGREELVYASYSGRLTCQDFTSGKVLWTFEQGAMPFKIRAFDLDGDGHKEIVSVSGAGQVVVLD